MDDGGTRSVFGKSGKEVTSRERPLASIDRQPIDRLPAFKPNLIPYDNLITAYETAREYALY